MADYWKKRLEELNQTTKKTSSSDNYWDTKVKESEESKKTTDIAPVKSTAKTDDRKWFKKGAFEDGYQFGDITKTIGGTLNDAEKSVMSGILGIGEKVVDAGAYAVGAIGGLFSDDFKEKTADFIAKDLYDERAVAEKIVNGRNPITMLTKEEDSILGDKSDSVIESGGQLLGTAALQAVGVPWYLTTGAASFGSEAENALGQGADYGEAGLSAAITAGAEILTEKISGGISFGGSTLDDALTKKLALGISNKALRTMAKLGMDIAGEGSEEVISQFFSNLGTSLYREESLSDILFSEEALDEYLESFIGGAALGGVGSGFNAANSAVHGVDATSGMTESEEKVFKKVYEDRVAEAGGEKLTTREKNKIYEEVERDMERGYISTDVIEEVLGGESYKAYKDTMDNENALRSEFDALGDTKESDLTVKQRERYNELKQKIAEMESSGVRDQFKANLDGEMQKITQGSRLEESYNERTRRGETFTADLTVYDEKQKAVVQKAIDSGILNNTNRTHEFVDMVAKISADKGVLFDFTNNEKLKDTGFAVDGKSVNGFVTKDGVTVNIDSRKSLNSVVGHEIAHVLEGTELYTELQKAVVEYAKTKGEYQGRYDSLAALYKDIEGADIDAELTADLVGDYLFTDEEFVNNLSVQNRNVFQKIYDEIKYLYKVTTAGSKEAREIERVKRAFDKAYKSGGKVAQTKYSVSDKNIKDVSTGYGYGETYFTMSYTQDGKVVGTLEYGEYDGEANVKMIQVLPEYRRRGIGTKLMQELQKKYPDTEIDFGMSTPDGTNLLNAITYDVTDEAVASDRQKLTDLQTELNELQGKLDVLYDTENLTEAQDKELHELGDRWQEVYETIGKLEKDLRGKRATKTFVKTDAKYSLSRNAELMQNAENANSKGLGINLDTAKQQRQAIYEYMTQNADRLKLPEDIEGNTAIKNSSYDITEENTTVCIRSMAADALCDAVAEELGRPLTVQDTLRISQDLMNFTDEPECVYCYVATDRKAYREFLGSYYKQMQSAIDAIRSGKNAEEVYTAFLDGRKDTKNMRNRFAMWQRIADGGKMITAKDLASEKMMQNAMRDPELSAQVKDARAYAQSASWAKKRIGYQAYNGHILDWSQRRVNDLNKHYGLRFYSFSDFSPAFVLENMQQMTDAAVRGLKGLAYTKVLDFAEIFAPTGININISVFGYDQNGMVAQDGMMGADWKGAQDIRNRYENVGITFVATNDAQIEWALDQDWIDVVIPYHLVRTGQAVAKHFGYTNYTAESGDTKGANWKKGDKKTIYPAEHNNDKQTYLDALAKANLEPRFARWVNHPNYMKLVNETRRSANDTPPMQAVFNVDAAKASLDGMMKRGGYFVPIGGDYENMQDIAGEIADSIRGETSYSLSKEGAAQPSYGNYNVTGEDVRLENIAPVGGANTATTTEPQRRARFNRYGEMLGYEDVAPVKEGVEQADAGTEDDKIAKVLVGEPDVSQKKVNGWQKFRTNFLDKHSVFEDLALKTKNRELMGKANFMLSSESRAQHMIGKGAKNVKALNDIRAEVEETGQTERFYNYMYHKHNVDRMSMEEKVRPVVEGLRSKFGHLREDQLYAIAAKEITAKTTEKTARSIREAREYLKAIGTKNKPVFGDSVTAEKSKEMVAFYERSNPEFKKYAEDVYAYMNHLRGLMVENGIISGETADLWQEMYPNYVPIRRLGKSGMAVNVPLDTGHTGVNAPIKRAVGGNSDIMDMFDTMAMRTEQTYRAIAKNSFGVELKNTLGTTLEKSKVSVDEVIDSIDAHEELLKKGENGANPTFTVFEDGERVEFEITEAMYDALKPTSDGLKYVNPVANTVSKIHKGILTEYNPVFSMTNAIKDAQDILINSRHPAKTYVNVPNALWQMARGGKWYTEYIENGGEDNTYFDGKSGAFKAEDRMWKKALGMPLKGISFLNNTIERVPRLAEYIASRKNGESVEAAMLDAARVTTNFSAGGDVAKFIDRNGATFLNASIQGFNQQVRNIREAKANGFKGWMQLAAKTAIAGIPALILNDLLWDDDEEYEELSDYVKDNYYIVAKMGDGKFVRIPKGRTLAVIQDAMEQVKNKLTGEDEVDLRNFLDIAMTNLAPNNPIDNNILAPIVQAVTNKAWYGEDIVPTRLQDMPSAEQYDEGTDTISKWLGEKTNTSPMKWNYVLNQYGGGLADMSLPYLTPEAEGGGNKLIAPLTDKFITDSVMKNQNVSDFYDTVDELTKNANSAKATDEDKLMSKYMNSVNTDLSALYQQKREIQNSGLSDAEKYAAVRDVQRQIDAMTKDALNTYGNVKIDGVYATVGDRHYHVNKEGAWEKVTDKQLEKQNEVTSGLGISPSAYWSNKEEYDFRYEYPEKYDFFRANGITYDDYANADEDGKRAYTWAAENPEKYVVSKAVTDDLFEYRRYTGELYDIKADKDEDGESISGSAKEKKTEYINNLDLDYGQKIILYRSLYDSKADQEAYNQDIVDYLNSREDISYEEMATILKELGFEVDSQGNISW